jgi:hypothetical protein
VLFPSLKLRCFRSRLKIITILGIKERHSTPSLRLSTDCAPRPLRPIAPCRLLCSLVGWHARRAAEESAARSDCQRNASRPGLFAPPKPSPFTKCRKGAPWSSIGNRGGSWQSCPLDHSRQFQIPTKCICQLHMPRCSAFRVENGRRADQNAYAYCP